MVEFCSIRCKAYVKEGFLTKKGLWKVSRCQRSGTIVSKRKKTNGEWEFMVKVGLMTDLSLHHIVQWDDIIWSEKPLLTDV
jgi:hypothetical protein